MRVLVIDDTAETEVKRVKEFALARRQSIQEIMRRMNKEDEAPGDDPQYMMEMRDGWKIVYTVEQHPGGWFHHISISVDPRDQEKPWPAIEGVEMILKLFGIGPIKAQAHGWTEDTGHRKAVNLLFPFTEPVSVLS